MASVFRGKTRRALAGGVVALMLLAGAAVIFVPQHSSNASPAKGPQRMAVGTSKSVVASGYMTPDAAKAAKTTASSSKGRSTRTDRPHMTPAQLAAYKQKVLTHSSALPKATASTDPSAITPNLYGGSTRPVLQNKAAGLSSADSGGWYPPDQAIATSGPYVVEGVNDAYKVYNSSFGSVSSTLTAEQLFASVWTSGDTASDPQITYDVSRGRFLIAWLEVTPSSDFLDIAISDTSAPPGVGSYHVYKIDPTAAMADEFCDYPTLGYDYWGMYVSCVAFANSDNSFLGNTVFGFSLVNMMAGSLGTWDVVNNAPTSLSCGSGCYYPAYRLSPAIEDGVPQAEWIVASDAGFGATSSNLTLCSLTNTQAIGTSTAFTASCSYNTLPQSYDDAVGAVQAGTTATLDAGFGFKQISYINGRIYFALPEAVNCSGHTHDGIYWASVVPQLSTLATHNPQWANGIVSAYTEQGVQCFSGGDAYLPTLIASSENDLTLVFNYSSTGSHPGIVFTGRANTDAPGTMGQGTTQFVISGANSNDSGRWGDYSACSLSPNGSSRGSVYCAGEYGGSHTALSGTGWDTELYILRME